MLTEQEIEELALLVSRSYVDDLLRDGMELFDAAFTAAGLAMDIISELTEAQDSGHPLYAMAAKLAQVMKEAASGK